MLSNPSAKDYSRPDRRAYTIGIICLKHRLTLSEVTALLKGQVQGRERREDTGGEYVYIELYHSPGWSLIIKFDVKSNIVCVSYSCGGWSHSLPPLASITPDTPIEFPPTPCFGRCTKAANNIIRSRVGVRKEGIVTNPPDFASLSYADAKTVVDLTIDDRYNQFARFAAGYPLKIIDQLREKALPDDKKALAMYLLGSINLQDTNTIAALIERVDFKVSVPYNAPDWQELYPWSLYPARDALLRIGESSVSPIVHDLPGETNELRRQLLCAVLATLARVNWTTTWRPVTAIQQLQQLRAAESDPAKQHNIDEALELLTGDKLDLNIGWAGYFGE